MIYEPPSFLGALQVNATWVWSVRASSLVREVGASGTPGLPPIRNIAKKVLIETKIKAITPAIMKKVLLFFALLFFSL